MASMESTWLERLTRGVFSWFSRKEVKTPLSFFFRVLAGLVVIVGIAMFACQLADRFAVFAIGVGSLCTLAVGVGVFAWLKPKHLVYGESGYRAEAKLEFGTESHKISAGDMATIAGMENPKLISNGGNS